jgi:hypothetical protein
LCSFDPVPGLEYEAATGNTANTSFYQWESAAFDTIESVCKSPFQHGSAKFGQTSVVLMRPTAQLHAETVGQVLYHALQTSDVELVAQSEDVIIANE